MAFKILQDCNNCGACEVECPNGAIAPGSDVFVIDPDKCTECVGFHATPQCAAVCPVEVCVVDPDREEGEAELLARAHELHPDQEFGDGLPSRFR
jgi:ferredoxin